MPKRDPRSTRIWADVAHMPYAPRLTCTIQSDLYHGITLANAAKPIPSLCKRDGGEGWIRTTEGISQQIYSLPRLATSVPLHGVIGLGNIEISKADGVAIFTIVCRVLCHRLVVARSEIFARFRVGGKSVCLACNTDSKTNAQLRLDDIKSLQERKPVAGRAPRRINNIVRSHLATRLRRQTRRTRISRAISVSSASSVSPTRTTNVGRFCCRMSRLPGVSP